MSSAASVALSGDTALIGAYGKTVGGQPNAGAAYVFTRSGSSWSQQAEPSDPGAANGDKFGTSVALSGDTLLVGVPDKTVGGQKLAGAAYVELLAPAPSLSLQASSHSIKVGQSATLGGVVSNAVAGDTAVQIERKLNGKLTLLKNLTLTSSGAFQGVIKAGKAGRWVMIASYKAGGVSFTSKPVTVTVHK